MAGGIGHESGALTIRYILAGDATRYFTFPAGTKAGMIILSGATSNKRAVYLYGSTSSGDVGFTAAFEPGTPGYTISASGQTVTIANGSNNVYVLLVAFNGGEPSISSTAPS